jgi:hypothetical protein
MNSIEPQIPELPDAQKNAANMPNQRSAGGQSPNLNISPPDNNLDKMQEPNMIEGVMYLPLVKESGIYFANLSKDEFDSERFINN